jgi:hypothetical protein
MARFFNEYGAIPSGTLASELIDEAVNRPLLKKLFKECSDSVEVRALGAFISSIVDGYAAEEIIMRAVAQRNEERAALAYHAMTGD